MIHSRWFTVDGTQSMVPQSMLSQSMVHGRWFTVDGTSVDGTHSQWYTVDGTHSLWYTVDGTQSMVHS